MKALHSLLLLTLCLAIVLGGESQKPVKDVEGRPAGNRFAIDIERGAVLVKGHPVTRETRLSEFQALLGKPDRVKNGKNTIYTYDDLGILLYQRPGEDTVLSITLALAKSDFDFYPKHTFQGSLKIAGQIVGLDTTQTALRKLREIDVKLDPATEKMQLPFTMLTHGNVVLSFIYSSSPNQLGSVGISWGTRGGQNGSADRSQPDRPPANQPSQAAGSRR